MNIVAVTAGLGAPSTTRLLTDQLIETVSGELDAAGISSDIDIIELKDLAVDVARATTTGIFSAQLANAIERIEAADGLVLATPVFTGSYSGLFKMIFDILEPTAISGTPVVLAATGGSARHALVLEHALRPMVTYLRAVAMPTAVYAAPEDWSGSAERDGQSLTGRMRRAASELVRQLSANKTPVAARRAEPNFAELLRRTETSP